MNIIYKNASRNKETLQIIPNKKGDEKKREYE